MKHCVSIALMSKNEIKSVLRRAAWMVVNCYRNARPIGYIDVPDNCLKPKAGFIFEEASSRTLGSFMESAERVGFRCAYPVTAESSSLSKGESLIKAGITAIQQGCDLLFLRTKMEAACLHLAHYLQQADGELLWLKNSEGKVNVPIINGGDGTKNHPTQVLLDALTIILCKLGIRRCNNENIGRLESWLNANDQAKFSELVDETFGNLTMAFVGDLKFSRVVSSWLDFGKKFNTEFILVAPSPFQIEPWRLQGIKASTSHKLNDALTANIAYFMRSQLERFEGILNPAEAINVLSALQGNKVFLASFKGWIMHAQPLYAPFPMIDPKIWHHPQVIIDMEAAMGVPLRMAINLECWDHRGDSMPLLEVPRVTFRELDSSSIEDHQRQMAEKWAKSQRSVNPLQRGMVLDRIQSGQGSTCDAILVRAGVYGDRGSQSIIAQRVESDEMDSKDIIFLPDIFVPDEVLAALGLVAPNLRVIELRGGRYRKLEFELPQAVAGIFECPNRSCVSIKDPQASSFFRVNSLVEDTYLHCSFCQDRFKVSKVVSRITK